MSLNEENKKLGFSINKAKFPNSNLFVHVDFGERRDALNYGVLVANKPIMEIFVF